MSWSKAWALSDVPYSELAFQAIYALKQGNHPPSLPPAQLVRRARARVTQSKFLVSLVLSLLSFGSLVLLSPLAEKDFGFGLPPALYQSGVIAAVLILELTLLWWTGIQILPTYLGASILPTLETLPIPPKTLDRLALILLLRLFDLPALTCLILTPFAIGLALGSWVAAIAVVPGVLSVIILAIALSLVTGRFFVVRVQGARGGRGQSVVRWGYLVLWAVPAFAMYGFTILALPFFRALDQLTSSGATGTLSVVLSAFPFSLALLPPLAQHGFTDLGFDPSAGLAAAVAYAGLVAVVALWLEGAPRRLARSVPLSTSEVREGDTRLAGGSVPWAVLVKDLRTASRTPGFAFLILLPLLDALAIGLWTYSSNTSSANAFSIGSGAVATSALLATFFGPAFFAIEVMGYSYTRTLPIAQRSLLSGKIALIALLYLVSAGAVLGVTLIKVAQPGVFLAFIAAEFPAVIGAALMELGLLFIVARRRGLPIVNLYTGAWWLTLVAIPGVILAGLPLVLFWSLSPANPTTALYVMASASLVELAIGLGFALGPATREGA